RGRATRKDERDSYPRCVLEAVEVEVRLGLRDGAPGGFVGAEDLLPAGQDAWRVLGYQRHDAHSRPSCGLRLVARSLALGDHEAVPGCVRAGVMLGVEGARPESDYACVRAGG